MDGGVARVEEMRNAYSILVVKPQGMRSLGRPRWEDNIRMDLREVRWKVWTGFVWLRTGTTGGLLVNTVKNLRVP
jgi:hypothetical protein